MHDRRKYAHQWYLNHQEITRKRSKERYERLKNEPWFKEQQRKNDKKWRRSHKEQINENKRQQHKIKMTDEEYANYFRRRRRIQHFLYSVARNRGVKSYFDGCGICLICGELNPLVLEEHHAFGRKNSDFTVTVCRNCHILISHFGNGLLIKGVV